MPNGLTVGGDVGGGGGAERPTVGTPLQKPQTLQKIPANGAPQRQQYLGGTMGEGIVGGG